MADPISELKHHLENAPAVAVWWNDNRAQMAEFLKKRSASKSRYEMVYSICSVTTVFSLPPSLYMVGTVSPWITAVSLLGMGMCWWMYKRHPLTLGTNNGLNPQKDVNLEAHLFESDAPLEQRKEVLQIIKNHPDPNIRDLVPLLKPLQNLELPNAWWKKLSDCVLPLASPVAVPTVEQQLQTVFVEIDQQCHSQEKPKTLKL